MSNKNITVSGGSFMTPEYRNKSYDEFDAELSAEMAKRTDKLSDNSIELALRVKQAREFLAWSANHMRASWLDWMEEANKAVKDATMTRMALEREAKAIVATGKDTRDFFNGAEYKDAHARMKEMLDLLDRFSEMKKNGTLDAFGDFILKVSCK